MGLARFSADAIVAPVVVAGDATMARAGARWPEDEPVLPTCPAGSQSDPEEPREC